MASKLWFKRSSPAPKAADGVGEGKKLPQTLGLRQCTQLTETLQAIDIVFVHGLTGGRETTWTDRSTSKFWPGQLLPSDVPDARIYTYGYDADVAHFFSPASSSRIGDHARTLLSELARTRERSETNERPLLFVAHSLGGLVVEDMLLSSKNSAEAHHRRILESTEGIVFMGTPHCGSQLADWAKIGTSMAKLVKQVNDNIVSVLRPESEVLARIQQEFHTMVRARNDEGKRQIRIVCFYEDLPMPGIGEIVPKHSAILPAYTSISIPKSHSGMTKFADKDDPGYQRVSGELWIWVRDLKKLREQAPTTADAEPTPSSSSQPRLLTQAEAPGDSPGHYYMNSVNNVGQINQGNSTNTYNFRNF